MALNCCPRHVGISKQMISQGKFRWRATVYSMSDVLHGANRDSNFYPHYKNSILYKKILQQKQPSFEICKNLHESNSSGFLFHQQLTISSWLGKEAQMGPKAACITQSPLLPNAGISKSYIRHLQTLTSVDFRIHPPSSQFYNSSCWPNLSRILDPSALPKAKTKSSIGLFHPLNSTKLDLNVHLQMVPNISGVIIYLAKYQVVNLRQILTLWTCQPPSSHEPLLRLMSKLNIL